MSTATAVSYKGIRPLRNLCIIRVTTLIDPFTCHTLSNHPSKLDDRMRARIKRTYTIVGTSHQCKEVKPGDVVNVNAEFFNRPGIEFQRVSELEDGSLIDYLNKIHGNQLVITEEDAKDKIDDNGLMTFKDFYYLPEFDVYSVVRVTDPEDLREIVENTVMITVDV